MSIGSEDSGNPLPGIASIVMDRATSTTTITILDGSSMSFPLSFDFDPSSAIVKFTHVPSDNRLSLETDRGDTIEADLPTLKDPAPRDGRLVVYLDQKDWSLLANTLYEPGKIHSATERKAAEELIALARERKIILPMSLGHMAETSRWTDSERRYRLALTITELSRGWQMRYPLNIRRFELRQSLATRFNREPLPPMNVFTLEPFAAQAEAPPEQRSETRTIPSAELANATRALTSISSYFDAILDSEAVLMNPIPDWVRANQDLTAWLARDSTHSTWKRKSILSHFRAELELEIFEAVYEAHTTCEELETWRESYFDNDIRAMGSLGLFNEIYQDKHLNPGTVWRDNDLIDMMYLTGAAAYADFVVGERSLVSLARQAASRRRGGWKTSCAN